MNLLTDQLIRIETPDGRHNCSLPEVYAALVADKIDCFPALRAHQEPAWHMFLVQLGAMAMHRAGLTDLPGDDAGWIDIIRGLTRDEFPGDEPWRLVVEDASKPAFLQPPVPDGANWTSAAITPDALDMLYISKNHDLKQAVANQASAEDWIFALIIQQTCDGALTNNPKSLQLGISRMNSGDGSRPFFGIAPVDKLGNLPRTGKSVCRDIKRLLDARHEPPDTWSTLFNLTNENAVGLTWTLRWNDHQAIPFSKLDPLFIEICRLVRILDRNGVLTAQRAGSFGRRIDSTATKGNTGDPWAPLDISKDPPSVYTLQRSSVHYEKLSELLFNTGTYTPSICMTLSTNEQMQSQDWVALVRGVVRKQGHQTDGFVTRILPLTGRVARGLGPKRKELHQLATDQVHEVKKVSDALVGAIGVARRGGVPWCDVPADQRKKAGEKQREVAEPLRARLDTVADRLFFPALWNRFEGAEASEDAAIATASLNFIVELVAAARDLLDESLADISCPSIKRPRAEARSRWAFEDSLRSNKRGFPHIFASSPVEEETPDAA
jgi:CRISPR system Cascade subunit CasA